MRSVASLVLRLTAVSLVALAVADPGDQGSDVTNRAPSRPVTTIRPKDPRRKARRRSTTTTTTMEPYEDADTTVVTTTLDPRSFDHTEISSCHVPLGMENGMITNYSLSASSSYDQSVSPLSSRIRTEIRGGAWCPNGLISPRSLQYLEIDFRSEYLVTSTESQGRFANSVGVEFVEGYGLEYWRKSLRRWVRYKDFNGSRLMPGNVNTYTTRKSTLEAPFTASKLRFFPYAAHPRTACMRVEVYGCLWKQAVVSYSAPKGANMATMAGGARFEDMGYDGYVKNNTMVDGLGQLTDSLTGPSDFELLDTTDTRGSRWVGWSKTLLQQGEVELTFNFSSPRVFHHVELHTNNMFTKDVQLFKEAEIYFSLEGERWQEDYVTYEPKQDRVSEHARTVHIDLENRTARHLMIKLSFQHEWILVSEVTFRSVPTTPNNSVEFLDEYYRTENPPSSKKKRNYTSLRMSVGLACGGVVGGAVFITVTIVYLVRSRARRRLPNLLKKPFCPSLRSSRNTRRTPRLALGLATCPPIHMLRPAVVDDDYREPYNIWRETLGRRDKREPGSEHNEYNEICEDPSFPRPYMMRRPDPGESFYAATDILHHPTYPKERPCRRELPVPGLFTSIKLPEADPPNGVAPLLDFPRGRMQSVTFLGEGPYGTLQICDTDGIEELLDDDQLAGERRRIVVVKTLWRGSHNDVKAAFAREATWGAGLKHPQLARVLGLSLQEPPCAALDRGTGVPLPTILRLNKNLNYGSLIHICCQIAAGMKYLESFELTHRDLAARNVTVSEDLTVKVSDYAMYCDEFVSDYHVLADGARLPLRWMAWESLLLGIYSPSSDAWSFGVTVWEVLTHCSAKPFAEMSDDQVVDNAAEWRAGGRGGREGARGARVPAAPPPRCRRELYDLMHECWRREPAQRPRFNDLHRFLERMTQGFKLPATR